MEKPNLTSSDFIVFIIVIAHAVCHFHYDTEICFMACAESFFYLDVAFSLLLPVKWFVWSMNENL